MMGLPRLLEAGDQVALTITRCCTQQSDVMGTCVMFQGEAPDDVIQLPIAGVEAAMHRLGFVLPDAPGKPDIVDYAGVVGERLLFARVVNPKGGRPLWRIEKAAPVSKRVPSPAPDPRPAAVSMPAAEAAIGALHPRGSHQIGPSVITRDPEPRKPAPSSKSIEEQRQEIRDAYVREFLILLDVLVPTLKKKKVPVAFDLNASVGSLMMEMSRKRCL